MSFAGVASYPTLMNAIPYRTRYRLVTAIVCGVIVFGIVSFQVSQAASKAQAAVPTFTQDVAPILYKNCAKCHQTGKLASRIQLLTYETARVHAASIKDKISSREMPPWPADAARSLKFRNDARLSQNEIDTVVAWVNGGTPKGKDIDLPSLPASPDGWTPVQGRGPDLVISLAGAISIPAEGTLPYANVLVKVPLMEDRWVMASETKPSNPAVVHHMALTEVALPEGMPPALVEQTAQQLHVRSSEFTRPAIVTPSSNPQQDMLSIYTPGSTLETYINGSAKLLKGGKNMYVAFNIHYQPTGKPETDRSQIALWFAPSPPEHQLFRVNGAGETILANGKELLTDATGTKAEGTHVVIPPIQPFEKDYELSGITAYLIPVTIYQFHPHAHYRGSDFTYSVVYPDGREQAVLSVPTFDHRWQMAYELETPLRLPAGSKLVVTAHYDNSKNKMHNPAPEKPVYFRAMNQSWDEMFTPFIQYSIDDEAPDKSTQSTRAPAGRLKLGTVVGCLLKDVAGGWRLDQASPPVASETQATTASEVASAKGIPFANEHDKLVGVDVFQPSIHAGERVAVKGVLLGDAGDARINVTSLQTVDSHCGPR